MLQPIHTAGPVSLPDLPSKCEKNHRHAPMKQSQRGPQTRFSKIKIESEVSASGSVSTHGSQPDSNVKVIQKRESWISTAIFINSFRFLTNGVSNIINGISNIGQYFKGKAINVYIGTTTLITRVATRIITTRSLNPYDSNFIELIKDFDASAPKVRLGLAELSTCFQYPDDYLDKLAKLEPLQYQISETKKQLYCFLKQAEIFYHNTPIHKDLIRLNDEHNYFENEFKMIVTKNEEIILDTFDSVYKSLADGYLEVPILRDELFQYACIIRAHVIPVTSRFNPKQIKFVERYELLLKDPVEKKPSNKVERPLSLRNIGNSCYMDSAFETFMCIPEVRAKLHKEFVEENPKNPNSLILQKRKDIQKYLLQLIDSPQQKESTYLKHIVKATQRGPNSLELLRKAIFDSGFNRMEFTPAQLNTQLDAASVVELMMDSVLNEKFILQSVAATDEIPGRLFYYPQEPANTFQIELGEPGKVFSLQKLINTSYAMRVLKDDGRNLIPKNGIQNGEPENPEIALDKAIKPKEIRLIYRLKTLPNLMAVHLKRFQSRNGMTTKNSNDVTLPRNGIIDLSTIYSPKDETEDPLTRYEVMGYTIHQGGYGGGHYVSHVKIGGKFYYCNDMGGEPYREISEEEFYTHKQPYTIMLRRLGKNEKVVRQKAAPVTVDEKNSDKKEQKAPRYKTSTRSDTKDDSTEEHLLAQIRAFESKMKSSQELDSKDNASDSKDSAPSNDSKSNSDFKMLSLL
ncbi:MAG: hypothetical protein H0W88_01180 [Parachlamydiaceae bacterium]|nr:hypothetical protein [Parachlamydiaceae bacterium]